MTFVTNHRITTLAYYALWVLFTLNLQSSGFNVLWEKPSQSAGELCFAQDGEVFALLGYEATVVYDRNGAKLFEIPNALQSIRHGVAFDRQNRLLVWETPNILRFLDRRSGAELDRKTFALPENPSPDDRRTQAQFSPDGAWVAYG
ncbi:MAG TPA: hypothetical protein VM680_08970 [Verrucomicrobiae bacterium]|nr:hypothetical protein [Verrucomicrobiae bacterium]